MSAWATQRKFYIFFTILVGISIITIGILFFFLYKPESCVDGLHNQSELGIDCGGVCPNACKESPKELLTLWSRVFPLADGIYSSVSYIENQNKDLYIPNIQYVAKFFDSNGVYVTFSSNYTRISADGITPVLIPFIISDKREISNVEFSFIEEPVFKMYKDGDINFNVLNTEILNLDTSPKVRALINFESDSPIRESEFVAIIYDQKNNAIGASRTVQEDINPSEIRELQFTWVNPFVLLDAPCPGGLCKQQPERVEIIPLITKR